MIESPSSSLNGSLPQQLLRSWTSTPCLAHPTPPYPRQLTSSKVPHSRSRIQLLGRHPQVPRLLESGYRSTRLSVTTILAPKCKPRPRRISRRHNRLLLGLHSQPQATPSSAHWFLIPLASHLLPRCPHPPVTDEHSFASSGGLWVFLSLFLYLGLFLLFFLASFSVCMCCRLVHVGYSISIR